ncbi:hypothetical protein L1987_38285 [Smallanthus sonchifolius]|uniref:Uncharacterized protein n=1 Tax=Smallanthus sonchifolius TaxID=185202 RepID=A0ACB9HIK1_9ASTR|nr:hypothetical protein L1987_38285 [Smallanthus sonchifolius]
MRDYVTVKVDPQVPPGEVSISDITGTGDPAKKVSKISTRNSASIAALSVMKKLNIRSYGLSLVLEKNIPLGIGLGSSAASAAAATFAVNELFGSKLAKNDLVESADIALAIMGSFVLVRSNDTPSKLEFPSEEKLCFALAMPTPMHANSRAVYSDRIIDAVKKVALKAGALGCTISGAGPAIVAVADDKEKAREIGQEMVEAFKAEGDLKVVVYYRKPDRVGAGLA